MALNLKTPAAARGALWVREGFRLFGRKPLAFSGLFAAFLFAALLSMFVPYIGGVLQMMMLPLLSLGFMVASVAALQGQPVQPGQFFEPLGGDPARRKSLLILCVLYGVGAIALLALCNAMSDGKLAELQALMASGEAKPEEVDALAAERGVFIGAVVAIVGATLLSVPFWHAPALVHWGGQGLIQALFTSSVAIWRTRGAFTVYLLGWAGLMLAVALAVALLAMLTGARQVLGVLTMPIGLVFSAAFYISLWFSFTDTFGQPDTRTTP